jgi:hypothetical protein
MVKKDEPIEATTCFVSKRSLLLGAVSWQTRLRNWSKFDQCLGFHCSETSLSVLSAYHGASSEWRGLRGKAQEVVQAAY